MRIAIVGAGVSGLVTAHLLDPDHEVTVFETAGYAGGHAHTPYVSYLT
ncbi:MAG TPA: NAD(P)-binding protein [Solirubrobacteraceae bacterium]|jgi:predicted NAD/FAD-binding protein|nr:NAD(P)-binding protein [Solirubrobacteraceae bacterium]